jgi:hypothetical protein
MLLSFTFEIANYQLIFQFKSRKLVASCSVLRVPKHWCWFHHLREIEIKLSFMLSRVFRGLRQNQTAKIFNESLSKQKRMKVSET